MGIGLKSAGGGKTGVQLLRLPEETLGLGIVVLGEVPQVPEAALVGLPGIQVLRRLARRARALRGAQLRLHRADHGLRPLGL